MIAVVPVRDGALPAGGDEAVAECGGRVCLFGSGTAVAAKALDGLAIEIRLRETVGFAPGAWACELASVVAGDSPVVLPASPDGRDLAPRVAALLAWPLLAGAMQVSTEGAALVRWGGLVIEEVRARGPFVATLQPGVRGVDRVVGPPPTLIDLEPMLRRIAGESPEHAHENGPPRDVEVLETLPPDVSTMDLAEAPRIVAGGAGLDGPERFDQLQRLAGALNAAVGASRVVTDRHWISHARQIGTTGVVVAPRLYVAFGISGAVQHTSGLGHPDHIVSVNTDPHCPMMQLADLAIVADANAVLDHLLAHLA